jgi:hypothetical protein
VPSNLASRSGAHNQVSVDQPCEMKRTTKSMSSRLARRSRRPSLCPTNLSKAGVREGRPNDTSPHQQDKTGHHQTTYGPLVRRRNVCDGHQTTPHHILSHAKKINTSVQKPEAYPRKLYLNMCKLLENRKKSDKYQTCFIRSPVLSFICVEKNKVLYHYV